MDLVSISSSSAGFRGGGAMLLDKGSSAHVFGSDFVENAARDSSGGQVRVATSQFVVHSHQSQMQWKSFPPVFPKKAILGQRDAGNGNARLEAFTSGFGCHTHEGFEDITDADECQHASFMLGFKHDSLNYEPESDTLVHENRSTRISPGFCSLAIKSELASVSQELFFLAAATSERRRARANKNEKLAREAFQKKQEEYEKAGKECDESMGPDGTDYEGCQDSVRSGQKCSPWVSGVFSLLGVG
jgi:hypothetical protein